jgi:hypothetical protein
MCQGTRTQLAIVASGQGMPGASGCLEVGAGRFTKQHRRLAPGGTGSGATHSLGGGRHPVRRRERAKATYEIVFAYKLS